MGQTAACECRSVGVASHWPFEPWGRFLPEHATAVALLEHLLHHNVTVVTSGDRGAEMVAAQRLFRNFSSTSSSVLSPCAQGSSWLPLALPT